LKNLPKQKLPALYRGLSCFQSMAKPLIALFLECLQSCMNRIEIHRGFPQSPILEFSNGVDETSFQACQLSQVIKSRQSPEPVGQHSHGATENDGETKTMVGISNDILSLAHIIQPIFNAHITQHVRII